MSAFWWNALENKGKIHWVSWEKMCLTKDQGGLGFRDIERFNQALLAKQAWRLIQHPDCLFAQFLKSRYFSDSHFSFAGLGNRPSYAWRSILHGRDLLMRGTRKMVGNGKSLSVWVDSWIYDNGMRTPLMKNIFINLNLKVEDLIDVATRTWNREKLEDLFYPEDIQRILAQRPVVSKDDFWVWNHTKSGDYSVKSGYWFSGQLNMTEVQQEAMAQPSLNGLKGKIWAFQTETKIKVFMWRALSGALSVADRITSRGMVTDSRCQVCGVEGESINHLLFTCTVARQIWALSGLPSLHLGFHEVSVFENFQSLLISKLNIAIPHEVRRMIPWILWGIWKIRNKLVFEGTRYCPFDSMKRIREDVEFWFTSKAINLNSNHEWNEDNTKKRKNVWEPPPTNWLKCNIGGVWDRGKQIGGCSWVLRNSKGKVLLHSRRTFSFLKSKDDVLLQSILWATRCMISHKISNVIFASEASAIIGAVNRPAAWPSFAHHAAEIAKVLDGIQVSKCVVELVQANRGANLIAHSATHQSFCQSYVASGAPVWIRDLFESEEVSSV